MDVAVPPLLSDRLVCARDAVSPDVAVIVSVTVPEKLLRLVSVIDDVPDAGLMRIVVDDGLADAEKSETFTVMVAECVSVPFVALTVTV